MLDSALELKHHVLFLHEFNAVVIATDGAATNYALADVATTSGTPRDVPANAVCEIGVPEKRKDLIRPFSDPSPTVSLPSPPSPSSPFFEPS